MLPTALAPTGLPALGLTSGDPDRPDQASAAYQRMLPRWSVCRALMAGTEGVRALGEAALPRFESETDASYRFRQQLVALANGFARTVFACVGLIVQQPPVLGDDMPPRLVGYAEDIDAGGTHVDVFTRELLLHGMVDGHAGILVDYPRVDGAPLDADTEQRLGLRPYWLLYQASDILVTLYETVRGVRTLTLLVLREVTERRTGRFRVETVTRYRVYAREGAVVTCELWEATASETTPAPVGPPVVMRNVTAIPFVLFVAGRRVSASETVPPLLDLADLNLEHYRMKTDIRNLVTLACVPSPVRIGAERDAETGEYPPLVFGPRSTIEAPKIDGVTHPVYWLTPDISVLEPAMQMLANNEAAQGAAGMAFLTPETRAAETAEAKRIDSTAQNATLSSVARNAGDALEAAFGFMAQYVGLVGGSVTVNTDFESTVMDAQTMTAYGALAANGKLSIETVLTMLEQGQRLPDGFDREEELQRILTENALPPEPAAPAPGDLPPEGAA